MFVRFGAARRPVPGQPAAPLRPTPILRAFLRLHIAAGLCAAAGNALAFEPYVSQAPLQVELRILTLCDIESGSPAYDDVIPVVLCRHPMPVRVEAVRHRDERFLAAPLPPADDGTPPTWQVTF
ncbi:hypothetical protein ACILG0_01395 [Pseudomonadota bacterium AL_CKDN230030165-1A_HGKHYDSX7]